MSSKKKSLAETHPEVAKQWHPTKNGDFSFNDKNLKKNITNFFDCIKKIMNNCINITDDNMYNGLIKKFKIFDK